MKVKNIKYKVTKGTIYGVTQNLSTVVIDEIKGDKKEVKEKVKIILNEIEKDGYKKIFTEFEEIERNLELSIVDLESIYEDVNKVNEIFED